MRIIRLYALIVNIRVNSCSSDALIYTYSDSLSSKNVLRDKKTETGSDGTGGVKEPVYVGGVLFVRGRRPSLFGYF